MKMDVGDDRYIRAFANLVHRRGSRVVRHCDPHDLAASLDHFLYLAKSAVNIGRVRLCHRLHDHRRTTADLYVTDFNRSSFSPHRHWPINLETSKNMTVTISSSTIA